jgi:integrase/recombinase XerD
MAAGEPDERLWFEFFLKTGMREQELQHCYWSDINFAKCTVMVSNKPDFNWSPKAYKERTIPVPESLIASLKKFKDERLKDCALLFPTSGCRPKMDFLNCCKAITKRAGLDHETFWLHKFRSTFATTLLQSGIDVRTVPSYLGHTDMTSTLRYLKPAHGETAHQKINGAWGAL